MDRYRHNAKWLMCFAPFRALSISAAYLTPFFVQKGLSLWQIFVLQSLFSMAFLLWEVPSGMVADRFGRAFCIKLSAPVAAAALILYGLSSHYWQFLLCELGLALANGLISGIDTALLTDSLLAGGLGGDAFNDEFVRIERRIDALEYLATAAGVGVAMLLVAFVSISSTIVADGLLTAIGCVFAFRLVEAPHFKQDSEEGSQEEERKGAFREARDKLLHVPEARWLVVLGAVLTASTWLAYWLSAPYYQSMGVPVLFLSLALAVRNLWKAGLSDGVIQNAFWVVRQRGRVDWRQPTRGIWRNLRVLWREGRKRPHSPRHLERSMVVFAVLAGAVYLAMATQQLWLVWAVLGHDVVQALHPQPITAKLNAHIEHQHRATLNSMINLVRRLLYTFAGPVVGALVGFAGLRVGFVVTGVTCSAVALVALARLHGLKTFRIEE